MWPAMGNPHMLVPQKLQVPTYNAYWDDYEGSYLMRIQTHELSTWCCWCGYGRGYQIPEEPDTMKRLIECHVASYG